MLMYYAFVYAFKNGWSVGTNPAMTVDWEASSGNKVAFPVGLQVGKLRKLGPMPVKFDVQVQYYAVRPQVSSAGTTGARTMSVYSSSKAAVRNLARTWAEDLKGTGIRVNVLSPGPTATELAKAALGEEGQKVYASMTPLQRMADPAEIGAAAAFLASQDSSFMTGSELAVDGGLAQI
jgi:NAD(P)-dependent dehydrogenase (short-subunit alcohol dehydrogenase family)